VTLGLASLAVLASALWLVIHEAPRARTPAILDVREIGRLAAAGQFDRALQQVEAYLRTDSGNSQVRIMAAQLALDRPDPQPDRAIAHLAQVRSAAPGLTAHARLAEGKALYCMRRYHEAEAAWLEALRLDPRVPEATWALLDLYYIEGRSDEARRLALRQHEIDPDPRDRVQLLLELVRQDAEPPEPGSVAARLAPVVRANPGDRHAVLALGLALVRSSQAAEGLAMLEDAASRFSGSPEVWDALLTGLNCAGQPERLAAAWGRVPPQWRDDDRLARHAGSVSQERRDWSGAARAYRRAWDARRDDLTSAYRLARALHALGRHDQAATCDRFVKGAQAAGAELRDLYQQADALTDLGIRPHAMLYQRLADNRERLGRRDEARAWHNLVLRDRRGDLYSRNAREPLQSDRARDGGPGEHAARDGRVERDRADQERPKATEP
jgi:tetratricopeptide (TPR) repeat protein